METTSFDPRIQWIKENLYNKTKGFTVDIVDDKIIIHGDIIIPYTISELPYKIHEVYGNVTIDNVFEPVRYGNLTTLKNFPTIIHGSFKCHANEKLTSLEYGPEIVFGDFICVACKLKDLKHIPKQIGGNLVVYNNEITDMSEVLNSDINGRIDVQFNPCETSKLYKKLLSENKISYIG